MREYQICSKVHYPNNSDTDLLEQDCYKVDNTNSSAKLVDTVRYSFDVGIILVEILLIYNVKKLKIRIRHSCTLPQLFYYNIIHIQTRSHMHAYTIFFFRTLWYRSLPY